MRSTIVGNGSVRHAQARTIMRRSICLLGLAVCVAWSGASFAQTAPEANAIIRSLAPTLGQAVTPGYGGEYRRPVIVDRTTVFIDVRHSVSLEVYFHYNSARITPRAKAQLRALGRALSSPELRPYRYLIAGHTDAVGSDEFNLDLSRRRATAVRDYLIATFPIDLHRLTVVGFGARRLKRPETPNAAINRRVEVALMIP